MGIDIVNYIREVVQPLKDRIEELERKEREREKEREIARQVQDRIEELERKERERERDSE